MILHIQPRVELINVLQVNAHSPSTIFTLRGATALATEPPAVSPKSVEEAAVSG